MNCGKQHLLVYITGVAVQSAAEKPGKAEDIVNLVIII
ncbi:MAG: hypothetical protein A4E66_02131 [Syntrophus sp. PtaB.Bin001]|nr:MAG: hypothetical protein A4E66_02131 [Syntrophus sp. PtaB.Bin001]